MSASLFRLGNAGCANRPVVIANVLADLSRGHPGRNSLIICAHYDSRGEDRSDLAPGADDNASGVAVLLETARVLAQAGIEPRVTLAFFGGEEDSLLGSSAFVEELLSEHLPLRGVINVDMVGYDEYGPQDIVVFTNPQSVPLALEVIETAVVSAVRDIGREPAAFLVSEPARVGRRPNGGGAVL